MNLKIVVTKRSQAQEYVLFNYIYINFKDVEIEVRIVVFYKVLGFIG